MTRYVENCNLMINHCIRKATLNKNDESASISKDIFLDIQQYFELIFIKTIAYLILLTIIILYYIKLLLKTNKSIPNLNLS